MPPPWIEGAIPAAERAALARAFLATASSNDAKQAACLQAMAEARDDTGAAWGLSRAFFLKDGPPEGGFDLRSPKAMGAARQGAASWRSGDRLAGARTSAAGAAAALARTAGAVALAGAIFDRVEAEKRRSARSTSTT